MNTASTDESRPRLAPPGAALVKAQALRLGFDLAGVTSLGPPDTVREFDAWLVRGFAGEMRYLERTAELRRDSRLPEPGMRSAIVVGMNYGGTQPPGPIARYARGGDYHEVMRSKLDALGRWFVAECGGEARTRSYVDTGPVLERDLARRAGLGWFGKNTNLINPGLGSFFFIGALFTNAELETDAPFEADRCGTCSRCLDACPTQAFTAPRVLDSTRCISYLTIELKGEIPSDFRPAIGELLYGCDICQDVCPWNVRFSRDVTEPALQPRVGRANPEAAELLSLGDDEWRARFGASAMTRAKRRGLARNAAVVLGNRRDRRTLPALEAAAIDDHEPLVREHAAWALAQFE
ncbi:MAG: tRNA epoxyqueuosine(34) reductase QueG [Gemmatimonadales bacterium]